MLGVIKGEKIYQFLISVNLYYLINDMEFFIIILKLIIFFKINIYIYIYKGVLLIK